MAIKTERSRGNSNGFLVGVYVMGLLISKGAFQVVQRNSISALPSKVFASIVWIMKRISKDKDRSHKEFAKTRLHFSGGNFQFTN